MARFKLVGILEQAIGRRDMVKFKVKPEHILAEQSRFSPGRMLQAVELRGKGDAFRLGMEGVVKRLDPSMVAGKEQPPLLPVVADEGKHPVEAIQRLDAPAVDRL